MIRFNIEDVSLKLMQRTALKQWIKSVVEAERKKVGEVNFIFCSDEYLLSINKEFLSHDYYTDVISFDYTEGDCIGGDIFISVDTVRANAITYKEDFNAELQRVMVHGILHFCGYGDASDSEKGVMKEKEDYYLAGRIGF